MFVYEHITGGGLLGQPLPPSMAAEGDLMLQALLRDLAAADGLDLVTLRDPRLAATGPATALTVSDASAAVLFHRCLEMADAVWLIAPESDGVLERLSRRVVAHGRRLLGCDPDAVRVAASKWATARLLADAGIAVTPTCRNPEALPPMGAVVAKPDDGAGCAGTHRYASRAALMAAPRAVNDIYQPWIEGEPLSLSVLCCAGHAQLLCVNRQRIALRRGAIMLTGLDVNALPDSDGRFQKLAAAIAAAMPGLWGYVGIDLMLTADGPVVMEVNPRLTTAYAGLAEALDCNPARRILELPVFSDKPAGGRRVAVEV